MKIDSEEYWNSHYLDDNTPWDVQYATPPLKGIIDSIQNKNAAILFPGAGNGHEAIYAHQQGFKEVYVCDWSEKALENILENEPSFPQAHLIQADFFEIEGSFDYLIEQTFFCAINPVYHEKYVDKVFELLNDKGVFSGVLFATEFLFKGPPFGGTKEEYEQLFSGKFELEILELCRDSIKPRQGNELFFRFRKEVVNE